jgi:hypothetical protein
MVGLRYSRLPSFTGDLVGLAGEPVRFQRLTLSVAWGSTAPSPAAWLLGTAVEVAR